MRTMRTVILTIAILGVSPAAEAETRKLPVTADVGSNRIVGTDPRNVLAAYRDVMAGRGPKPRVPPLWDGRAAERIAEILPEHL